MDFSNLNTGYDTLVGFLSKLRDSFNEQDTLLKVYIALVENDCVTEDQNNWRQAIIDCGFSSSEADFVLSQLIPINNDSVTISEYVNGENSNFTFVRFIDFLNGARNIQAENPLHTEMVYVYDNPANPNRIGTTFASQIIPILQNSKTLIEDAITAADNALMSIEGGIDDAVLITKNVISNVSTNVSAQLEGFVSNVLTYLNGHVTNEGATAFVTSILGFFGFGIDATINNSGVEGLYTGVSPANAWFSSFINFTYRAGFTAANWIATHYDFVRNPLGYMLLGLMKLVGKGVSIAAYYVGSWFAKTVTSVVGVSGAVQGSNSSGDGTIGNGHSEVVFPIAAIDQFDPVEVSLLRAKWDEMLTTYTVFTPGTKRIYTKDAGQKWRMMTFIKPVNPFVVKQKLDDYGIILPFKFKTTSTGEGVGVITDVDSAASEEYLSHMVDAEWEDFYEDICQTDLTFPEGQINPNANFAAGLMYSRFLDLLYIGMLMYHTNLDQYQACPRSNYSIKQYMHDNVRRAMQLTLGGNFTNKWFITNVCQMYDKGVPETVHLYVSTFNDADGIVPENITSYRLDFLDWYCSQLFPLLYLAYIKGTQEFWMSYLPRASAAKASYMIANDADVSWNAARSVLTGVAVAATIIAAYLAVRYIPKLLTYKRQISMQMDTAAFNYGDNPTVDNYNRYRSLRRKALLLGALNNATEGTGNTFLDMGKSLIGAQNNVSDTECIDLVRDVKRSITGD